MSVRDKELDDLMRRLEDMAMDDNASDLDGNKLFDVLCRVECAEERIAITKQLRIIVESAKKTAADANAQERI